MLDFISQYGIEIAGGVIALAFVIYLIYTIIAQPEKIKEWLIYAVAIAEAELGGKTGQLKLRRVYDLFCGKYPIVSKFISFETFQAWTEDALLTFKKWLETNDTLQKLFVTEEDTEDVTVNEE